MSLSRFPCLTQLILILCVFIFLNAKAVFSAPINSQTSAPVQQSNDVWASVVANVAPLMALVGERNAKEFMRTTTTWHQLLPLSAAPLGILAIMVSAIRLSGPGFLRRLVGRDSERRSEALVELTPLSVRPATSVYTRRAVEIETSWNKDGVAFICGHVKDIACRDAVVAFQQILSQHKGGFEQDKDMETVLVIWNSGLSIEAAAELTDFVLTGQEQQLRATFPRMSTASLSYRTTGISPTQTDTEFMDAFHFLHQLRDIFAFVLGTFLMVGVQVLGLKLGEASKQTFFMGIVGYGAVVVFTFSLLLMVKGEIRAEKEVLPSAYDKAIWTFSDSRHAEHRRMKRPASNTLITARPLEVTPREKLWRSLMTTILTVGLVGSYVVYYLSMRVAPWWVSFSSLGLIWFGALYRAIASPNTIAASSNDVGSDEHWIGLFRDTLGESILATVAGAHRRPLDREDISPNITPDINEPAGYVVVEKENRTRSQIQESVGESSTILLTVQPIRTSLRTWSGAEDVMKVGLEMAKITCRTKVIRFESHNLHKNSKWLRVVRLRLAIYIPGLVWRSNHTVDYALARNFDLETLMRDVLKVLHVSMDHTGTVSRHAVDSKTSTEISHVLCGPIANPPVVDDADFASNPNPTLRSVLIAVRDNATNATTRKYSLEQAAMLLPTIILACIYDRWLHQGMFGNRIESLQKRHVDGLALSGKQWLGALEGEFERLGLWTDFLVEATTGNDARLATELQARDGTSGNYRVWNVGGGMERDMEVQRKG
jgi:hypothetical protein